LQSIFLRLSLSIPSFKVALMNFIHNGMETKKGKAVKVDGEDDDCRAISKIVGHRLPGTF
jgi:hypothetical protein